MFIEIDNLKKEFCSDSNRVEVLGRVWIFYREG